MQEMRSEKKRILLSQLLRTRDEVRDRLKVAGLTDAPIHQRHEVMRAIGDYNRRFPSFAIDLRSHKLRYLIDQDVISPYQHPDTLDYLYTLDDLLDAVLTQTLRKYPLPGQTRPLTLLQAKMLHQEAQRVHKAARAESVAPTDAGLPSTQLGRGQKYLASRALGMALALLVPSSGRRPNYVVLRKSELPPRHSLNSKNEFKHLDRTAILRLMPRMLASDVVGEVRHDGEILLPDEQPEGVLKIFSGWYYLKIASPRSARVQYELVLGAPDVSSPASLFHFPTLPEEREFIFLWLETCVQCLACDFARVTGIEKEMLHRTHDQGRPAFTSPIDVAMETVPMLSPSWDYCAVLVPDSDKTLKIESYTYQSFPRSILGRQIETGRLMTGWAYEWRKPIVVQKTLGKDDPRLMFQLDEAATAALAVPTWIGDSANGVLYVASRGEQSGHELAFPPGAVRYFWLLGGVLGELLEREFIRTRREAAALRVSQIRVPGVKDWRSLGHAIEEILTSRGNFSQDTVQLNEIFQIVVIRLEEYGSSLEETFGAKGSLALAEWFADHTIEVMYHQFFDWGIGPPVIFSRSEPEYVGLVPSAVVTDEEDRKLRGQLRELLNSVLLPIGFNRSERLKVLVWSMPYSWRNLLADLESQGTGTLTSELLRHIENNLRTVHLIEKAHHYEAQGNFSDAYTVMREAHDAAPNEIYTLRHLAKYQLYLHQYKNALEWQKRVIKLKPNASHYRRLAQIQLMDGETASAKKFLEKALDADPANSTTRSELAMMHLMLGNASAAISELRTAAEQNPSNRLLYDRLIAEAYLEAGEVKEAMNIARALVSRGDFDLDMIRLLGRIRGTIHD